MKTVIYISWMPLTERVERDWYLSHLQAHGVTVEYWDVTRLLFKDMEIPASLDRNYMTRIEDYQFLESRLKSKDTATTNFVMIVNYEDRFYRLYRLLTKYGCCLFFFEWGNFPIKDRSKSNKYGRLLRHPGRFLKTVSERAIGLISKKFRMVKPFDTVFAAGNVSLSMHPQALSRVPINHPDYDSYLQTKEKLGTLVDGRYCVFLDINLPFQSDIKVVGWDYIDGSAYGKSLNRFFQMIEDRYQVKTVIAAHPKSQYNEDFFEGRVVLKGVTQELVKDAEFVLSHHSTSISYAVLNRKPLVFIYTNDMLSTYPDTIVGWMGDFAEYLGAPIYNVDQLPNASAIDIADPDSKRYDLYKYNYLTCKESEHMLTRDIFLAKITA